MRRCGGDADAAGHGGEVEAGGVVRGRRTDYGKSFDGEEVPVADDRVARILGRRMSTGRGTSLTAW